MKKLLLSLFVGLFSLIGFGYCDNVYVQGTTSASFRVSGEGGFYDFSLEGYNCFSSSLLDSRLSVWSSDHSVQYASLGYSTDSLTCVNGSFSIKNDAPRSQSMSLYIFNLDSFIPTCDDPYTSLECQTEYNLIPVEDVDTNYCVGNGLCLNECGSGTDFSGDLQYSNIYINSILHPGEENIFIDIPDYIQWDYSVDTGNFNIYVGSGYDMDYMNSIIKINSYRPTSSDFTNIFVSGLTLIFPYIFVLLLIVFIWKLIKRVFK